MQPHERVSKALRRPAGEPAIVAFVTAGYPSKDSFLATLSAIADACDAIEVGVPFSDPMADGVTIQRSSEQAIKEGVSLSWILRRLGDKDFNIDVPILLMSYLNPLLAYGYDRLANDAAAVGVSGFMVPDLPFEESSELSAALHAHGLGLVQFVSPATPTDRIVSLCAESDGFVYAVTRTGITGGQSEMPLDLVEYLDAVKAASSVPVCAGFGVRNADHVALIGQHADGVIVGSALVEVLEKGGDPAEFLRGLRSNP